MFLKTITFAGAFALLGSSAIADCGISGGKVSILSNDFPAIQAFTAAAAKCAGNGVTVDPPLTKDHKDDRKRTRLTSRHVLLSRMPSSS